MPSVEKGVDSAPLRALVIGGGNMGAAFVQGIVRGRVTDASLVEVVEPHDGRRDEIHRTLGCRTRASLDGVTTGANLILVAIKPQEYPALAPAVQHILAPDVVVLSCMAGISLSALSSALGGHRPVVRSMPNLPVQVGEGMIVYMTDPSISPEATALVEAVLRPCGRCLRVFDEMLLDAATALSGSGTGYVAYFMEEMVKAGESLGFSSEDAELIVGQTILGAAAYWRSTMRPAREIREMVTSPNGTTAAALSSLHAADVGRHIREAIFRAYDRSRELGGLAPPSR